MPNSIDARLIADEDPYPDGFDLDDNNLDNLNIPKETQESRDVVSGLTSVIIVGLAGINPDTASPRKVDSASQEVELPQSAGHQLAASDVKDIVDVGNAIQAPNPMEKSFRTIFFHDISVNDTAELAGSAFDSMAQAGDVPNGVFLDLEQFAKDYSAVCENQSNAHVSAMGKRLSTLCESQSFLRDPRSINVLRNIKNSYANSVVFEKAFPPREPDISIYKNMLAILEDDTFSKAIKKHVQWYIVQCNRKYPNAMDKLYMERNGRESLADMDIPSKEYMINDYEIIKPGTYPAGGGPEVYMEGNEVDGRFEFSAHDRLKMVISKRDFPFGFTSVSLSFEDGKCFVIYPYMSSLSTDDYYFVEATMFDHFDVNHYGKSKVVKVTVNPATNEAQAFRAIGSLK